MERESDRYPEKIAVHKGMPRKLWYMGRMPDPNRKSVAIVGARSSTAYGNAMAKLFAEHLAEAGVQIISGMAWGIDSYAHEGALKADGDTFAVLGCAAGRIFPGNKSDYQCAF